MLSENTIKNTLILFLSGLAEYKGNTNEIWVKAGCVKNHITVEVVDANNSILIVRGYSKDGQKSREVDFVHNQEHGKYIEWHKNGHMANDAEYYNGNKCGKFLGWRENGRLAWEEEYDNNGNLHGKHVSYRENGTKRWDERYHHGHLIKMNNVY